VRPWNEAAAAATRMRSRRTAGIVLILDLLLLEIFSTPSKTQRRKFLFSSDEEPNHWVPR
jgi:hypothetical protein